LGNNFLSYDIDHGALEGIAVLAVAGDSHGAWEYSVDGGDAWAMLPADVSAANAMDLQPLDELRFLPNEGFTGSVSLRFAAWDADTSPARPFVARIG
jgi:hypothetical protein